MAWQKLYHTLSPREVRMCLGVAGCGGPGARKRGGLGTQVPVEVRPVQAVTRRWLVGILAVEPVPLRSPSERRRQGRSQANSILFRTSIHWVQLLRPRRPKGEKT